MDFYVQLVENVLDMARGNGRFMLMFEFSVSPSSYYKNWSRILDCVLLS